MKFSVGFVTATFQSITTIVTRSVWEVGNLKCVVETLLLFVFVLATIICYYMSFSCIRLHDIEKKMDIHQSRFAVRNSKNVPD